MVTTVFARTWWVASILASAVALTACTGAPAPVRADPPLATPVASKCPRSAHELEVGVGDGKPSVRGRLPADFVAAGVYECTVDGPLKGPSPEISIYEVEEQVSSGSDYSALVAALGLPDLAGGSGACSADAERIPLIVVTDDKLGYIPRMPIDECGKTRTEVLVAIANIRFGELSHYAVRAATPGGRTG